MDAQCHLEKHVLMNVYQEYHLDFYFDLTWMVLRKHSLKTAKKRTSSFLSVITKTSICFITSSFSWSSLFGSELIFVLSMITLFMFLNLRFSISDEGSRNPSFMDLSNLSLNLFSSAKLSISSSVPQRLLLLRITF